MKMISRSVKQTLRLGRVIAGNLEPGDIICLFGGLGSGKTVLAKGIAQGLGIKKEEVTSSSFVLISEHNQGRMPLFHFDFYRLKREEDILALGYEEYFYGEGVSIVEWADRLKRLLPKEFLKVELGFGPDSARLIKISVFGERYKKLAKMIRRSI